MGDEGEYPPYPLLKGDVGDVLKGLVGRPGLALEYGLTEPMPPKPLPPYSVPKPVGESEPAPTMGEKLPAAGELRDMYPESAMGDPESYGVAAPPASPPLTGMPGMRPIRELSLITVSSILGSRRTSK